jgi:hypothetical protein
MATTVDSIGNASGVGRGWASDQPYFTRYAMVLTALILFGFIQFELRGFVDIRTVPAFLHVHAGVMVAWLAVFVSQNLLVQNLKVAQHRQLGWLAAILAALVAIMAAYTGYKAIALHIVPPFFTAPFFLALTWSGAAGFAFLVTMALLRRTERQFHRRAMLGSLILITEPAFGRLLPMPLLGQQAGETITMILQLGMVGFLAVHDRYTLGRIHSATLMIAVVILGVHMAMTVLPVVPAFAALATGIAAG